MEHLGTSITTYEVFFREEPDEEEDEDEREREDEDEEEEENGYVL